MNGIEKIAERIRQQITAEAAETKDIGSWPIGWVQQVDKVANLMMRGGNIAFVEMQKESEKEKESMLQLKNVVLAFFKAKKVNLSRDRQNGFEQELKRLVGLPEWD